MSPVGGPGFCSIHEGGKKGSFVKYKVGVGLELGRKLSLERAALAQLRRLWIS